MKVLKKINVGEQELNTEIKRLACAKELILAGRALRVIFPGPFISSQSSVVQHQTFEIQALEQFHKLIDSVVSR